MYGTSMQAFKDQIGEKFKQSKLDNQRRQREVLGGVRRDFRQQQYQEHLMRSGAMSKIDASQRN